MYSETIHIIFGLQKSGTINGGFSHQEKLEVETGSVWLRRRGGQ